SGSEGISMRFAPLSLGQKVVLMGIIVVLGLLVLSATATITWVGDTALEIECVVMDAATGGPISGAIVQVKHAEGGFCERQEKRGMLLITDTNGSVKHQYAWCMCYGRSGLFTNTYFVRLPPWVYQVSAKGYDPTEWTELDMFDTARQVQRGETTAKFRLLV